MMPLQPRRRMDSWYKFAALAALILLLAFTPARRWVLSAIYYIYAWAGPAEVFVWEDENTTNALLSRLRIQQEEISRLEALLELPSARGRAVPAKIILGGGYLFSDILLINRGTDAGINVGDAAVFENLFVLGKAKEAEEKWTKIIPFSRLGEKTVLRGGKNLEIIFEAEGRGGGTLFGELPASLEINAGDQFWWGENPDYLVGLADTVKRSLGSQLQFITIKNPVPYASMVNISVLPL